MGTIIMIYLGIGFCFGSALVYVCIDMPKQRHGLEITPALVFATAVMLFIAWPLVLLEMYRNKN